MSDSSEPLNRALDNYRRMGTAKGARSFGFYWTRKSAELAQILIEEFCPEDGVVLDPFLGSGSTALGLASSSGKRMFIGVELNEMPIENLKVSLGKTSKEYHADVSRLRSELQKLRELYSFQLESGPFELSKVVHKVGEDTLQATAFLGRLNGKSVEYSRTAAEPEFEVLNSLYMAKLRDLPALENSPLATNSRIAVKPGMKVSDVFGPLGFAALSALKEATANSTVFKLVIGASVHLSRLTDSKSQSQFPFWHPKQEIHEKSVFDVVQKKLKDFEASIAVPIQSATSTLVNDFEDRLTSSSPTVMLIRGSATQAMKDAVPTASIDLVITDPPYFDQVAYSEYLKLWEFFTGFESDLENEIVESARVGSNKTRENFLRDLEEAFVETRRTMKDGALALVYFKDSKPKNLHDFIQCLERAGLIYETQVHLTKSSYTYKQNTSKQNTVGGDAIMVFVAGEKRPSVVASNVEKIEDLDQLLVSLFAQYIDDNGPSTLTEALDNHLIGKLYPTGYLSRISKSEHLVRIVSTAFNYDPATRKWSAK
jgi:DNA modification methylase